MTHHTDAERAHALAEKHGATSYRNRADTSNPAFGFTLGQLEALISEVEQAARRAPAAPVPQGWKMVPVEPTREMIDAMPPVEETGYWAMYEAALAAAPQPPEAAPHALQTERGLIGENPASKPVAQGSVSNATLAAPVEFPEPEWWINYCAFTSKETASRIQESELASAPLYTEQQVRQLLAAHGIGKDKQG